MIGEPAIRWDEYAKKLRHIPRNARCVCCGQKNDPTSFSTKLCFDHWDRWKNPDDVIVLCVRCNAKRGDRSYVPFGPLVWYRGMRMRALIPRGRGIEDRQRQQARARRLHITHDMIAARAHCHRTSVVHYFKARRSPQAVANALKALFAESTLRNGAAARA